ncbi:MAG: hypothetical protein CBC59_000250 [Euryarchaeota archaeon TMED99]|nr:MAG: hypothetical protein CBC59_000250 [Euryarchaeota archaeon TMED99]
MDDVFPSIQGKNLNKRSLTIPDDFTEKNLFIIVAFLQWQQRAVDEVIEHLEANDVHLTHHIIEVPVIQQTTWLRQVRLDTLMRMGIRDREVRQRTITVYLDKKEFQASLDIPNDDSIHWFVVDHATKKILMRGAGNISSQQIEHLRLKR